MLFLFFILQMPENEQIHIAEPEEDIQRLYSQILKPYALKKIANCSIASETNFDSDLSV